MTLEGIDTAVAAGIARFSDFISAHMGLHFPENRRADLNRGLRSAAQEFGFKDAASCMQWLMSSPLTRSQIETLASHLTVGETYFLRDRKLFEALESSILPALIRRKGQDRRLRIWSAGCATGEEPYSLAVLLSRVLPALMDWDITILATDINSMALRKAASGVYSDWSFRDSPAWFKGLFFRRTGNGCFEILPRIRKMVTFSYLNLAEDSYPSLLNNTNAMDMILCRNVLMYFVRDMQTKVASKLYRCLVDKGYLVVSPSETSHVIFSRFSTVNLPDAIFYLKEPAGNSALPISAPVMVEKAKEPAAVESSVERYCLASGPLPDLPRAEKAMESAPEPQADLYPEGLALYKEGRYAESEARIRELLLRNPDDPAAMRLLSNIYANRGKLAEAFHLCEKSVVIDRLNPVSHYLLANILQEQGRLEEAANSFKRSLYLDQDFALAHFALGSLRLRSGRMQEASRHFDNALVILEKFDRGRILPEADGMTAGRLKEIIEALSERVSA